MISNIRHLISSLNNLRTKLDSLILIIIIIKPVLQTVRLRLELAPTIPAIPIGQIGRILRLSSGRVRHTLPRIASNRRLLIIVLPMPMMMMMVMPLRLAVLVPTQSPEPVSTQTLIIQKLVERFFAHDFRSIRLLLHVQAVRVDELSAFGRQLLVQLV